MIGTEQSMSVPSSGIQGNLVAFVIIQQVEERENLAGKNMNSHAVPKITIRTDMNTNIVVTNAHADRKKATMQTAQIIIPIIRAHSRGWPLNAASGS